MSAIILDIETHKLNGLTIEIAYIPTEIESGEIKIKKSKIFQQYFSFKNIAYLLIILRVKELQKKCLLF